MSLLIARRGGIASFVSDEVIVEDYAATIISDNPIAYWRLGETSGTTAVDEMGAHDGTYNGSPTLGATGLISEDDTAVTLDASATADYVNITGVESFADNADAGSFEVWIKPLNLPPGSVKAVIEFGDASDNGAGIFLRINTSGQPYFQYRVGGTNYIATGPVLTSGEVYHIVGTWDATDVHIYVNDVLESTVARGANHTGFDQSAIGVKAQDTGAFTQFYFDGTIDELAIYGYALTPQQVSDHYAAGVGPFSPVDQFNAVATASYDLTAEAANYVESDPIDTITDRSGNGYDLLSSGSARPLWTDTGGTAAARFSGTQNTMRSASGPTTAQPITYVALGKSDNPDATSTRWLLANSSTVLGTNNGDWAYYANNGSAIIRDGTDDGAWHVFVVVFDGASTKFYIDGGSDLAAALASPGTQGLTTAFTMGSANDQAQGWWDGDIAFAGAYEGDLHTDDLPLLNALGQELADRAGITWTDIT